MMQQPPSAAPAGPAPPQKQATPEQQQAFDKIYAMSAVALYSEPFVETAKEALVTSPDIVDGLARVASSVGFRVYKAAAEQNADPEPIVLLSAGRQFMTEVADYARVLGREVSEDEEETAFYSASDIFREEMKAAGLLTDEELEQEALSAQDMVPPEELSRHEQRMTGARDRLKQTMMGGQKP